jgi:5-carboxymethyl-2-hydroxymuconate isomerase
MPHLTIEYSANLRAGGDFSGLCTKLARTLVAQQENGKPLYPIGGVRVRAYAAEDYSIANGAADAGFVHAALKIGAGRSPEAQQATGDALFAVITDHFAELYQKTGLALSLEMGEFSESGTWKHNNLHSRLR